MAVSNPSVRAKIEAPPVVLIPKGGKRVSVDVRTELTNDGEHDLVLHLPSEAHRFFWHVLDDRHREVMRGETAAEAAKPRKGEPEACRAMTLAAGHSNHETETLSLAAGKLKEGIGYTLRAEIWGQIAETGFTVLRERKAGAGGKKGSKGKKAAKKK